MSVPTAMSQVEERLFDEYSLGSMQPSDEWQNDRKSIEDCSVTEDEDSYEQVDGSTYNMESLNFDSKHSFFAGQSRFVDYLSNLVPTFSVEGSKGLKSNYSYSTATYSQVENSKPKRSESNHNRCIIENPESIQERQDENKQFGRLRGRDEDCTRDQSTSCSVEEISQISEITMDIPTVAHEEKFGQCSALPTISETKQFEAPIATTCAAGVAGTKARCSAAADTTTNKRDGNNDFIDFVFELVEDAFCKPIKTSKSERKKLFMEAFQEESEKAFKLANFNAARESSRHSRSSKSSSSTKRSANRSKNSSSPVNEGDPSTVDQIETSAHSRRSSQSRMKVVDKAPLNPPGFQTAFPDDEDLTMDWSKMMSLAEKQLEAAEAGEGKTIISNNSKMSEASKRSEKSSVYQSVMCDGFDKGDVSFMHDIGYMKGKTNTIGDLKSSMSASNSLSSSTHAALADEIAMDLKERSVHVRMADEVVQELRELSALDTSSFEEESRFLLTSTLFRFLGSLIPNFGSLKKQQSEYEQHEEFAFDEISETLGILSMESKEFLGSDENFESDEKAIKFIRYVAFIYAFLFWPSGIARRTVPNAPLRVFNKKRADDKPASLLQLVSERD